MVQRPLPNDANRPARQLAMDDLAALNRHEGFEALAGDVEMWGRVLVMIHAHHDPEKDRDYRHRRQVGMGVRPGVS
jgi:hypothetical protein